MVWPLAILRLFAAVEIPNDAEGVMATSPGRALIRRANSDRARSGGVKKSSAVTCHGWPVRASAASAALRTTFSIGPM